ncbi:MAG: hypothetical protein VX835_04175 [Pseudomonadota bacterium]|nr:hypothetical protein [Pseudomonadota bacterium]
MLTQIKDIVDEKFQKKPGKPEPSNLIYAQSILEKILKNKSPNSVTELNLRENEDNTKFLSECFETALKKRSTSLIAQRAIQTLSQNDRDILFENLTRAPKQDPITLFLKYALFLNLGYDTRKELDKIELTADQKAQCLMSYYPPNEGSTLEFIYHEIGQYAMKEGGSLKDFDTLLVDYYFENKWFTKDSYEFVKTLERSIKDPVNVLKKYLDTRKYKLQINKFLGLNDDQKNEILMYLVEKCIHGYVDDRVKPGSLRAKLDLEMKYVTTKFMEAYGITNLKTTIDKLVQLETNTFKKNALKNINIKWDKVDELMIQFDIASKKGQFQFFRNLQKQYQSLENSQRLDVTAYLLNAFIKPLRQESLKPPSFSLLKRLDHTCIYYLKRLINDFLGDANNVNALKNKLTQDYGYEDSDLKNIFQELEISYEFNLVDKNTIISEQEQKSKRFIRLLKRFSEKISSIFQKLINMISGKDAKFGKDEHKREKEKLRFGDDEYMYFDKNKPVSSKEIPKSREKTNPKPILEKTEDKPEIGKEPKR